MNKIKSLFFEKINKINMPLATMTKMRRENTQISKIRNKKGEVTTNTKEIQGISLRTYIPINWKILKKWTNF
jgi:Cu/Ag efflux protein CusF